jgi:glycosyltransferase involved in cell wall biosynthesis
MIPLFRRKYDSYFYIYENVKIFKIPIFYMSEFISEYIDPDIITYHSPPFPKPNVLGNLVSLKKPMVIYFHGFDVLIGFFHNYYIPFYVKSLIKGLISIPLDIKKNFQLRRVVLKDKNVQIVVPSNWMKRMVIKYLVLPSTYYRNIHVIPNPVDTSLFKPLKSCDERYRNLGISVRSLYYKYGVDILIKALYNLKDIKIIIVGKGPLRKYLEEMAKKIKANVEFIERIHHSELPKYYNEVGFFVSPSRTEAQGVAMCEALACGTPVVATSVGGIPEFVIHGYNGLLVNKLDPNELRKAIIILTKMSDDHYCMLSHNAVKFARIKYSSEVIIAKELNLFFKTIDLYNS